MPRPGVGNPGNRGGGRKSFKVERDHAELLDQVFFGDIDLQKLKSRLERKTRKNLWDIWLLKAITGNERFLEKMFDKIFPAKVESKNTNLYARKNLTPEEQKERINHLLDELRALARERSRIPEGNGKKEPVLSGAGNSGVQPHNGATSP